MSDKKDKDNSEEAEIPKGSTITLWTAEPGKVLELKRTFYFMGDQQIVVKDIVQIGVAQDLTRVVTKDNKIYIVYTHNLLGVEIIPPLGANPILGPEPPKTI